MQSLVRQMIAAILVATLAFTPADTPGPPELAGIRAAAAEHQFNLGLWEALHLIDLIPGRSSEGGRIAVERYFVLGGALRQLDVLSRDSAIGVNAAFSADEDVDSSRDAITAEMAALEPAARQELRMIVAHAVSDAGLMTRLPVIGSRVFPPVSFTFDSLPLVLGVSPRDKINLLETILLAPDRELLDIESLEAVLAQRGLSAVVDRIGGLATYPSLVTTDVTFRGAVSTIAHEWVHHYLFLRPLGQTYGSSAEMTTINETLADIVGLELAAVAFGEPPPSFAAPSGTSATPEIKQVFSSQAYLRETRLRVDEMLAAGLIDEAEAYMEERRLGLAENGVFFRKINQAFFAFRGSYGESPVSVSPAFRQLTIVRQTHGSLGEFMRLVQEIRAPQDLARLAAEAAESLSPGEL